MKKILKNSICLGLFFPLLVSLPAYATTADISIANTVLAAMTAASSNLMSQAIIWLGAFMSIQFVLTNIGLLKSGADIEAVIGKLIGSLLWFGFCVYVLENGPAFIDSVGTGLLEKYATNIPTPGSLLASTLSLCTLILAGIAATGSTIAGIGNSSIGMTLVYILFIVFSIGMFLAIKVFMLTLELGLIVLLSPLSFSFLGMNALKDQGIAPFKALISLAYRIILLGIICSAADNIFALTKTTLETLSWTNPLGWKDCVQAFFSAIFAFPFLAYLAYKSDSIAASLASGSTNMGTSDIAGAAAAGAAAGALAAGAAGAVAGAKPIPMGDIISKMMGNGSVSNASPSGSMKDPSPAPAKPASASASLGDKPPVRGGGESGAKAGGDAPQRTSATGENSGDAAPQRSGGESSAPSPSSSSLAGAPENATSTSSSGGGQAGDAASAGIGASGDAPQRSSAAGEDSGSAAPQRAADNSQTAQSGNAATAGISGGSGELEKAVGDLVAAMSQPKKPSFSDRLSNANRHIEQEKAATHVSINTHHSD